MNSPALWTSSEVAAAVRGTTSGEFLAHGVSIDSRTIRPGDLFIAIKGPSLDGHEFVGAALRAGAAGALVAKRGAGMRGDSRLIVVADTMAALHDLARAARRRARARILAITGSVGKTSTKEMLAGTLGAFGASFASGGNLNNQWGAPLSLSRMARDSEFGVFELGMNHAGEISPLAKLVRPEIAIITWVSDAHLEFFASVEAIALAKAEIFDGLQPGGIAVLPADNDHFELLSRLASRQGAAVISFGAGAKADCRLIECRVTPAGNEIAADIRGRRVWYRMAIPGRHQAINSLAVLAAISALDLEIEPAVAVLASIPPLAGRGKRETVRLPAGDIELIDESYNASPASMRAALGVLASLPRHKNGRRIAVLGDMREMGESGPDHHRSLAADVIAAGVDCAFLVGPLMRQLHDALPGSMQRRHEPDSSSMIAPLTLSLRAGDLVLIKGSLGTRMAPLVEAVRSLASGETPRRVGNGH